MHQLLYKSAFFNRILPFLFLKIQEVQKGLEDNVHFCGVEEAVIGVFDRDYRDAVFFGESFYGFAGDELVGCSLGDPHAACIGTKVQARDIIVFQRLHKGGGEHYLAVEAGRNFSSLGQYLHFFLCQNSFCKHSVHDNGRAAQADFPEGIPAVVGDVLESQISAETGGAGIKGFGMQGAAHEIQNSREIGIAVSQGDSRMFVISVARPVENQKSSIVVFFQDPAGELLRHGVVLVAREAVTENDDMLKRLPGSFGDFADPGSRIRISGKIYFTPNRKICTAQIKIFFHSISPKIFHTDEDTEADSDLRDKLRCIDRSFSSCSDFWPDAITQ